jgi:phage terminase large subunit GpA-like protein
VWGFGIKEQCWLIDHDIIWKDPGDIEAWKELELALNKTYKNVKGAKVGIHSVAIDTGYLPELVRNFVRSTGRKRVHAVVGINKYGMNVLATKPRKNERDKTLIWPVGTDTAKKMIMARFRIEEEGPGYVSFPLNTEMNMRDIFYQLTSERAVVKYSKGKRIYVFEKKTASSRNEALDCFVYALAALYLIGDRVLDKMESYVQQMTDKEIDKKKEKKEKKKKEKPYDLTDELVKSRMQRFKPRRGTWQRGWNI